jgi:prephenate dehydratase
LTSLQDDLNAEKYRVAIQGELGSNSHMAALEALTDSGREIEIVPCPVSAIVFERLLDGSVDAAVLPIENSLHGSVAEHYDLLLQHPVRIVQESLLRIRFNLIAMPGVAFEDLRRVLSHPVALAQCRRFLAANRQLEAVPFYDTAGSVKHLMESQLSDTAGIAPALAAQQYGGEILKSDLEDHTANFTRFHTICREDGLPAQTLDHVPNKMTLAFSVEHRPGTLVQALQLLSNAGVDLTRIESRPVPGSPWEYIFYVEFRFSEVALADAAVAALLAHCHMVKELGRYRSA